ncbi:MAG: hypothetical protein L6Q71_03325 [Planctomycetes bacterium]|nr:hypothetical protein [Planctomycetota bacterium]
MGLLQSIAKALQGIAPHPAQPEADPEHVDKLVAEKLAEARKVADSFVDQNVQKLKGEAWAMVDELERRLDAKLDQLEKRLDERLKRELYWKLTGLKWTLIFVLLATLVGIGYTLVQRYWL